MSDFIINDYALMIFGARDYDKCGFRRKWARNRKVGELIRLQERGLDRK